MPLVSGNFNETPEEILPIAAGQTELLIHEPPEHTTSKKGNPMVVMSFRVVKDGPDKGRTLRDYVVNPGVQNSSGQTKLKRIALSSGVAWNDSGLDTDDLIGQTVLANIVHSTEVQRDAESGEPLLDEEGNPLTRVRANIRGYVVSK